MAPIPTLRYLRPRLNGISKGRLDAMVSKMIEQAVWNQGRELPGEGKRVSILGVPLHFGQSMAGVDLGPGAIRVAKITARIGKLGYEVNDLGDLPIERPRSHPSEGEKLKYLTEVHDACERLASQVEQIVDAGELPITIGGDHSIAIGSLAGVVKAFRKRDERLGLIYFDAHADMNTPDTSPSGNIHGMPLSALLGYGAPELVNVAGSARTSVHGTSIRVNVKWSAVWACGSSPCARSMSVAWPFAWTRRFKSPDREAPAMQLLLMLMCWSPWTRL